MSKYAVIEINKNQYLAEEGQSLVVDKLVGKPECKVLLTSDGKLVKVGKPYLKQAKVSLKVSEKLVKEKKLHVETFKAKSRYRRKVGFRAQKTVLQVGKIS